MPGGEVVLDASVAVKVFITEAGSADARALATSGIQLIAPDFVLIEMTNVAAMRLRRGDILRGLAEAMVASAPKLFSELEPARDLVDRALGLAIDFGFSGYDATYIALAERRGCDLVTADGRMIARAAGAKLATTVRPL
jgi:predicted nucleic acid-binding protein